MNKYRKLFKLIIIIVMAVIVIIAALFTLWWKGIFLPGWVKWENKNIIYYDSSVVLENKRLALHVNDSTVWQTEKDWLVQDVIVEDINFDGKEELIVLLWKHGSFGEHMPVWQRKNDIKLKQHIFIYQWNEDRVSKIRPVWMSSEIDYLIESIVRGGDNRIITNLRDGEHRLWQWKDFGLKLLGPALEHEVSFVAVGDNLIHRWLLKAVDNRYDSFYKDIKPVIENADIASVNQETVLVDDISQITDYPRFGSPSGIADALYDAGFDVITLANNHIYDKGDYGLKVTTDKLEEIGLIYTGVSKDGSVKFIEKNGIKIALLNYTFGTNGQASNNSSFIIETLFDEERMIKQIDYARDRADIVIVYPHWGEEYSTEISEEQKRLCDIYLDHSVDVVIGTHPHVVQDYEILTKGDHNMYVYYSLGNFVSGQDKPGTTEGAMAQFIIKKDSSGKTYISSFDMRIQSFFVVKK